MALSIGKQHTLRYNLPYNKVPTVTGMVWGGSMSRYTVEDYGCILDAVYEMTDMVSNGNGVSLESAMNTVMVDKALYILPSHRTMIYTSLAEDSNEG